MRINTIKDLLGTEEIDSFINKIACQIHSDTICHFSKTPKSLLQLQIDSWKPLIKWI